MLKFSKKELEYLAIKVFENYIQDPSNKNDTFKRVKIRNLIKNLNLEGLDLQKFSLTIKNLKFANDSIKFFTKKNLKDNSTYSNKNKSIILSEEFFYQPEEVVFRSFTEVIKIIGQKHYPSRGRKIYKIIDKIKNDSFYKTTLGNCVIKKVNKTIILSKEHQS